MNTWKKSPLEVQLLNFIDCYWFLEKNNQDCTLNKPKLNPNPEAHLIIPLTDQLYHYTLNGEDYRGHGEHIILPVTCTMTLHHQQSFRIIGVKFKVGALYSLPFLRDMPRLNYVLPSPFKPILEILSPQLINEINTENIKSICNCLDQYFIKALSDCMEDTHSRLVTKTLPLITTHSIAEVLKYINCSSRTLERSFKKVTGMTLKQYQSICLLENVLEKVYQLGDKLPDWSGLAIELGFCDQPHLIRFLKANIGATPSRYLQRRDLTIDVYGNFE